MGFHIKIVRHTSRTSFLLAVELRDDIWITVAEECRKGGNPDPLSLKVGGKNPCRWIIPLANGVNCVFVDAEAWCSRFIVNIYRRLSHKLHVDEDFRWYLISVDS